MPTQVSPCPGRWEVSQEIKILFGILTVYGLRPRADTGIESLLILFIPVGVDNISFAASESVRAATCVYVTADLNSDFLRMVPFEDLFHREAYFTGFDRMRFPGVILSRQFFRAAEHSTDKNQSGPVEFVSAIAGPTTTGEDSRGN